MGGKLIGYRWGYREDGNNYNKYLYEHQKRKVSFKLGQSEHILNSDSLSGLFLKKNYFLIQVAKHNLIFINK